MSTNIFQSEVVNLKNLNNLFIEMSAKSCNQHCKHCFIEFPKYKKEPDFINIDIIKQALHDTKDEPIECIYLTGAEPMTHPDFNSILRLCLKYSNVCICTNGSFINEKKSRFLKKVEEESTNEIVFKISMDHYEEVKNDEVRYHGAYRQALFALKHLVKYSFNPIIAFTNYYNLSREEIYNGFQKIFLRNSLDLDFTNIQITPWHDMLHKNDENIDKKPKALDCEYGRILTSTGVYTCPFLANDYRGRCGSTFHDYTKKSSLETSFCNTCVNAEVPIFSIDYSQFK